MTPLELLVMIGLTFTAPAGDSTPGSTQRVAEYGVQVWDALGVQAMALAYGDPLGKTKPKPRAPRTTDTIYCHLAEDWKVRMFTVWGKDAAGNKSGPSSGAVVAAGPSARDTIFWWVGASVVRGKNARHSEATYKPGVRMVKWELRPGSWNLRTSFGGDAMSEALRAHGAIVRDDVLQAIGAGCSCRDKEWP